MPETTYQADGEGSMSQTDVTPDIYVIKKTVEVRDQEGNPYEEEQVDTHEGYFLDRDSAQARVDMHTEALKAQHAENETWRENQHAKDTKWAKDYNQHTYDIRHTSHRRSEVSMPPAFRPRSFEEFLEDERPSLRKVVILPQSK